MIQEKVREELTPRDATYLEDLLKKEKNSLTPAERELLIARRDYLTEETLERYDITGPEIKEEEVVAGPGSETLGGNKGKYEGVKFADLKKDAKERGIKVANTLKQPEIIALLEQYDNLQHGDEFQGKIAYRATEEMIKKNDLADQLEVGDLYFVDKDAIQDEEAQDEEVK